MIALSWLLLIGIVGGALAVIDGVVRARGRGTAALAIVEIVVAALFLLSLFIPAIPFGSVTLAIVTLIVLVAELVVGKRRSPVAIIAVVLLVIWLVLAFHWITVPGIN